MPKSIAAPTPHEPDPRSEPRHGDCAADLIYDGQASPDFHGPIWIYPACYDDFTLARRRAHSLSVGFGVPFQVDLFGASGLAPFGGELTTSAAIYEPGYYAFTTHDPRPRVLYLSAFKQPRQMRQENREEQRERGEEQR